MSEATVVAPGSGAGDRAAHGWYKGELLVGQVLPKGDVILDRRYYKRVGGAEVFSHIGFEVNLPADKALVYLWNDEPTKARGKLEDALGCGIRTAMVRWIGEHRSSINAATVWYRCGCRSVLGPTCPIHLQPVYVFASDAQ